MRQILHCRLTVARALLLIATATLLAACAAQVRVAAPVYGPPVGVVQVRLAPPALPVYVQPPCPVAGWLWTPGYWRWGPAGYFWVPGTWVAPPRIGLLWTPGYWGFVGGLYVWHAGYWGPHVGFYGGIDYGFGYDGDGYLGGRWIGHEFIYNRAVTRVNVTIIHNTYYRETVINRVTVTRVSYNGGPDGVRAEPTAQQRFAARERHFPPTALQREQVHRAQREPELLARENRGHPTIAATARPGAFHARGVVRARGAVRPRYARRHATPPGRRARRRGYGTRARRRQWRKAGGRYGRRMQPNGNRKRQWRRKHPPA
jgi:hypothetical protein